MMAQHSHRKVTLIHIIFVRNLDSQGAGTEKWEFRSTIATENV